MANPILAVVFPAVAVPVEPLLGVTQLAFLAKALTDRSIQKITTVKELEQYRNCL